jgi:hypothetical protein
MVRPAAVSPRGPFVFASFFDFELPSLAEAFRPLRGVRFGEDLACKSEEASLGIAPGFKKQPCFPAGFLKELLARQPMLDGNLGKKKSALCVQMDK